METAQGKPGQALVNHHEQEMVDLALVNLTVQDVVVVHPDGLGASHE